MDTAGKKGIRRRKNKSWGKKIKLQLKNIETSTEKWMGQGNTKYYSFAFKT